MTVALMGAVCGCQETQNSAAKSRQSSTSCQSAASCQTFEPGVKASSFGWNAADATVCLQKAFDSCEKKIIVDRQASDWIVNPIFVTNSNIEIVFADGVVVRAIKDGFKDKNDALIKVRHAKNVLLRGEGTAMLVMNKADYMDGGRYAFSEWRHTLSIIGGKNITVRNLTMKSSGGDGVYVRDAARNVRLENLICRDHLRQGISLISCVDFVAKNCDFSDTTGAAPQCGVDLEPNTPKDKLTNVLFEDCTFNRNAFGGIKLHLAPLNGKTDPISIVFRRCVCDDNARFAIGVHGSAARWLGKGQPGPVRGTVLFENCTGKGNRGAAMDLNDMVPDGFKVTVRDCAWDATGGKGICRVSGSVPYDFAGLFCENVKIVTDKDPKIEFLPYAGTGACACGGVLTAVKDGKATEIDLAKWAAAQPRDPSLLNFETVPLDYHKLVPVSKAAKLKKPVSTGFLDKHFTFIQCLPAAGEFPVTIQVGRRVANRKAEASVHLRDRAGTDLGVTPLKEGKNTIVLKAHRAGALYRLEVRCGGGKASVTSDWPGCGVLADETLFLFGTKCTRWFSVPASAEEVRVQVSGNGAAKLLNAARATVDSRPNNGQMTVLRGKRAKTAQSEFWGVSFTDNIWLSRIRVGAPALPILCVSPESAIVTR